MKTTMKPRFKPGISKTAKITMALLMCMSLFIFPMTAYASNNNTHVAPPSVEAEIIGSLLRIRASSGFFAVEAVFVNDRRFNHRVDSALVIDISQYIATGETIAVYAVDFAGNHSNTVLLTPPVPAQPPVPNNITPEGQGALLDHLTNSDRVEFITIETPSGNVFYLIIDHTRSNNNVYFLNPVTEWDLLTLAAEADLVMPSHIFQAPPPNEPTVAERPPTTTETPPAVTEPAVTTEPPSGNDGGGRGGLLIFMLIAGAAAFGVIYYLKILKPKKEREMYGDGGDEEYEEADGFEDVDDDKAIESDVEESGYEDGYDVDDDRYYSDSDTDEREDI